MSEPNDNSDAAEAAALLKAIGILWDAMPQEGRERVRQEHSDVAEAAEKVSKLLQDAQHENDSASTGEADE